MSELKITKGRWHNIGVLLWSSIGTAHEVQTACIANFDTGDVTDDEEFANVKIAAAAPDLYEALESLVNRLRNEERWPTESTHNAYLQMAERALARARGEQT